AVEVALDASRSATLLVEAHVPGRELTVNAFSVAGRFRPLTVTDRLTAAPPAFGVALAHAWPSELEPRVLGKAIDLAAAAAAALTRHSRWRGSRAFACIASAGIASARCCAARTGRAPSLLSVTRETRRSSVPTARRS